MTTHAIDQNKDHHKDDKEVFGFWLYIMSDCLLFAALFATFAVLRGNTFGGPSMKDIISYPYILAETIFLLCSSFTYGMAMLAMYRNNRNQIIGWLVATFLLGLTFVVMEVNEFHGLIMEGHGPQLSGFLTAFFTLVGTHGFHVSLGLLWMVVLIIQLMTFGNTHAMRRRLTYLGMFWAFLDIVWIFVFTIVYLMGAA